MSRDHYDALIEQLLREVLGGDRPRDMAARVLAQAKLLDRARRVWWIGAGAAAAASIALAISVWSFWPRAYPQPQVAGAIAVSTPEPERGSTIVTPVDEGGQVTLGGYAKLDLAPDTALTLGGSKFEEKVFLERGHIDVNVKKNRGEFDVSVGSALIHVTGTKFAVSVIDPADDDQSSPQKKLQVAVKEGSVEVKGVDNPRTLLGGQVGLFEVSEIRKAIPPEVTTEPPKFAPGTGMIAGMREGNRIGTRGSQMLKPPEPALARGAGRGLSPTIYGQIVIGNLTQMGVLHSQNGVYILEAPAPRGNLLLFSQQAPLPEWHGILSRPAPNRVVVTWQDGKVVKIESATPAGRSGSI